VGNGEHSDNGSIQTDGPRCSTRHTFSRRARAEYIICRWVSTRAGQLKLWAITVVVCCGHSNALVAAVGMRQSRRGVVSPSCRLIREMLDNLLDLGTFTVISVPTSNKELPESIRYTQVDGIGRLCGTIAVENLEDNLCTPERIKRNQPSQHLGFILQYLIRCLRGWR